MTQTILTADGKTVSQQRIRDAASALATAQNKLLWLACPVGNSAIYDMRAATMALRRAANALGFDLVKIDGDRQ